MKKVAVIGAGISGISISNCLQEHYKVKVFESSPNPGGLIRCECIDGNLYHVVGGHVFNSKRSDVLDWFWKFFDRDNEFVKVDRNASVFLDKHISYPIEDHIYEMEVNTQKQIIDDLLLIASNPRSIPTNFEEFLKYRFGETLYKIYFKPYNEKIWKQDLATIPLAWLEGKLPMPTVKQIIFNNFCRAKETSMVHSSFFYSKINGSQFLADRLSENLTIEYNVEIESISRNRDNTRWLINYEEFDVIVYTGNIKKLPSIISHTDSLLPYMQPLTQLEYHGTTSVLCEIEQNSYSWIYLPNEDYQSHRIICTGNFAANNNANNKLTSTVEFTNYIDKESILQNLKRIPHSPKYITHRYTECTYPIQTSDTRLLIQDIKTHLESQHFYLLGRFAEWEYYNMDTAIGAAIDLSKRLVIIKHIN
jgi:protoporphyrinogen oxidase